MTKQCTQCNRDLPLGAFHKNAKGDRGLHSWCKQCRKAAENARIAANPEKHRGRVAKWRAEHPDENRAIQRRSHHANKQKRNESSRLYRAQNAEKMRALTREWFKNNPEKWRLSNAERRAAKMTATPSWARSELEALMISEMYDLAVMRSKLTGIPWHVDHIVPLRSDLVCGLHCATNLRVIPGAENYSKGNRTWPDGPRISTQAFAGNPERTQTNLQ